MNMQSVINIFSRLPLRNALCSSTPSVHTWQLHQRPHPPLPPVVRSQAVWRTVPTFFARNKNICSAKCFCKWPNGLLGCRAAGVQLLRSWARTWFQVRCLIARRETSVPPATHDFLDNQRLAEAWWGLAVLNQIVAPLACSASPLNP